MLIGAGGVLAEIEDVADVESFGAGLGLDAKRIANLEAETQNQDASQQTIMAELQRINQALLLQLQTQQDANQINSSLAMEQIVAQKQQQDAMKSAFRDSSGYESYYNANIATTNSGAANLLTQAY